MFQLIDEKEFLFQQSGISGGKSQSRDDQDICGSHRESPVLLFLSLAGSLISSSIYTSLTLASQSALRSLASGNP